MWAKAVIRKKGSQYCIYSKKGKELGCFKTREQALKRLRQIEFYKHQKASISDVIAFRMIYGDNFEPNDFGGKFIRQLVSQTKTPTKVQTVIVSKKCAKTREEATKHAKKHGKTNTSRETSNSYRFRQAPPSDFQKGSFRTMKVSDCVTYVIGKPKK